MISTTEADRILSETMLARREETVTLAQAAGRTLCTTVRADRPAPPGDRVSMDGIAIRYADWLAGARRFRIQQYQPAGSPPIALETDGDAACLEIATGAILEPPADTVIPVERITIADGYAAIDAERPLSKAQNVHATGADHLTGAPLLSAGAILSGARIAVLASVGMTEVRVAARPRITIAATGDELVPPAAQPATWQLRSSNGPGISAALANAGYDAAHEHWRDCADELAGHVHRTLDDCDVLIVCGGISVGKKDYVKAACEANGADFKFLRVRQRPGKPFAYATRGDQRIFCLPGNPVAAMACVHRYLLPFLAHSEGRRQFRPVVRLDSPFAFAKDLSFFLPVSVNGDQATHWLPNGSGDWATPALADGIVEIPADLTSVDAGTALELYPYY